MFSAYSFVLVAWLSG